MLSKNLCRKCPVLLLLLCLSLLVGCLTACRQPVESSEPLSVSESTQDLSEESEGEVSDPEKSESSAVSESEPIEEDRTALVYAEMLEALENVISYRVSWNVDVGFWGGEIPSFAVFEEQVLSVLAAAVPRPLDAFPADDTPPLYSELRIKLDGVSTIEKLQFVRLGEDCAVRLIQLVEGNEREIACFLLDAAVYDQLYQNAKTYLEAQHEGFLTQFVHALETGDTQYLDSLLFNRPSEEQWGRVTSAPITVLEISEPEPRNGSAMQYRVQIRVGEGSTWMEPGEHTMRLTLGGEPRDLLTGSLDQFTEESRRTQSVELLDSLQMSTGLSVPPFYRNIPAYDPVDDLFSLFGFFPFDSTEEFDADLITDMATSDLRGDNDLMVDAFSVEELQAKVLELFGISDFDGTQTRWYDARTDQYQFLGRGTPYIHYLYESVEELPNGDWQFVIQSYSDSAWMVLDARYRYTTTPNGDGTYRLVRCEVL